jgi:chitinase
MRPTYAPPSGTRRLTKRVLAGVAALAVAASAAVAGASLQEANAAEGKDKPAKTSTRDTAINGFRSVGYFTQWGVYGRGYQLKQLDTSDVADELSHVNYAFANIHHENLECFEANKAQGEGPNGSDGAGDAWADFGMGYTAANSVSGVADTWDQPLAGSFNQLKQLKAKHPDLKVMMSIGGWTWSKNFSLAAATDASREKFVSSCVDMFIKGNLPVIDGRGGAGAAAGVFDGFDIDWEWPGSSNGNVGNHVDPVNDARNFKLLLAEFREQLDALGASTGKDYELSAFLPANPADITAGGWNDPEIFEYLDFGNVQGYDLHGAWDANLTGHQGNLYHDPADPREPERQFSADLAVQSYVDAGIDPAQLGLGLAMYGRGWTGATSSEAWGTGTGPASGQWEAGINDYDVIKNVGTGYYDADLGAAWRHDGNNWWSYDNTQSVTTKAQYIRAQGLGGAMWWDLSGDRSGELTGALQAVLGTGTPGPVEEGGETDPTDPPTDPTDPPTDPPGDACASAAWSASATYVGGDTVSYGGHEWRAKWWTQGETPTVTDWGVWQDLGAC